MDKGTVHEELKYIFTNVNEWLKFAEAKNGALLALDCAVIVTLFGIASNSDGNFVKYLCIPTMMLLFISVIFCLTSFHPKIAMKEIKLNKSKKEKHPNIYFFGYLCMINAETLLSELTKKVNGKNYSKAGGDSDLANQIICNSKIAMNKYSAFKNGLDWALYAVGYSILATIIISTI